MRGQRVSLATVRIYVPGIGRDDQGAALIARLRAVPGVRRVTVNRRAERLRIVFDDRATTLRPYVRAWARGWWW